LDLEIRITAEPVDTSRCKFVVSEPVHAAGVRRFASAADAAGSPLAEAIFAIPDAGVQEIVVAGNVVTVVKTGAATWQAVGRPIGAAIRQALRAGVPAVAPRADTGGEVGGGGGGPTDDELYERVAHVFEAQVNPMVARHGGRVELIDVQDAMVLLRMGGGCQGCGMADVTLRQGIEGVLGQHVPEVKGIVDITDHAAGNTPYFQAAKK
jgi:Fe-S cluster biogenesis protein NfuA